MEKVQNKNLKEMCRIMKNRNFPKSSQLEAGIIESLSVLGGTATVTEINQKVIEILSLPEEIVNLEDDTGLGTKLDYRLRWCRTNLKNVGRIRNIRKGVWELLDE